MLILIAESKTMAPCDRGVDVSARTHSPVFDLQAADIMLPLVDVDNAELCRKIKISPAMAADLRRMAYDFHDKSVGLPAVRAFTGVVFKAFDYESLSAAEQRRCNDNVRIISSLYGWLRPDDIIKNYRLDFTARIAPDCGSLCNWWRRLVTDRLLAELCETGTADILDLMPADAAKCIDWKQLPPCIRVWKADFRQIDGASVRTPHAGRLKILRGLLLRQIIIESVADPDSLLTLISDEYMAEPQPRGNNIIFTTV